MVLIMKRVLSILLLSAALISCGEDAPPRTEEEDAAFKAALAQAHELGDCEVAYTIQAEVIHGKNEAEFRRYKLLAHEAHLAASVALADGWSKRNKRPFEFYSGLVDDWTEVRFQWWEDSLERATEDGGGDVLMLLDVYHSPDMEACALLRPLQSRLAARADEYR